MYRTLFEQIPAVVFVAYLDEGKSHAYVSPQIEAALGFSQEEWLKDPILWYQQIHPEDKRRWSLDAAEMFATGTSLRSAYRVLSRQGRVVWFRCEAKMLRHPDGNPWFILGVGFDITELKEAEQALQEQTKSLRSLSTKLLELQDQERRRIARELHDGIGQYLVALKLNVEMLESSRRHDHKKLWSESKRLLEQCLSDIRNLSYLLHPPLLDDAGLLPAIKAYVEGFSARSAIEADLQVPAAFPSVPKGVEIVLFRVLQESLTNVVRHSGTKRVEVVLQADGRSASLRVTDFGRGIPANLLKKFRADGSRAGVGLAGMRERVSELGGRFDIKSDKRGTEVVIVLPLEDRRGAYHPHPTQGNSETTSLSHELVSAIEKALGSNARKQLEQTIKDGRHDSRKRL
jgi:PAS domain S-box-containing protein